MRRTLNEPLKSFKVIRASGHEPQIVKSDRMA
jgi:hypothetical protein